jgi:hypothetical protein
MEVWIQFGSRLYPLFFSVIGYLSFDVSILGLPCIFGTSSKVKSYIAQLLVVPFAVLLLTAGLSVMNTFPRLRPHVRLNVPAMSNSLGMLYTVFFIAICGISLQAFNCADNPNKKRTMSVDRSIVCWEDDDHITLIILSVSAILIYPVFFLVLTGWVVFNYDRLTVAHGTHFVLRTRFLVARMVPDSYHFGFLYNLRNFILALIPAIFSTSFGLQVFWLMSVFVGWLCVQLQYHPW